MIPNQGHLVDWRTFMLDVSAAHRIAVATSAESPGVNADDELLVRYLAQSGVAAQPVLWNDAAADWSAFDAVLIRTTWDYHEHYARFLGWLAHLEDLRVPTINPNRMLRWNSDKRYLLELPPLGIAIIPTQIANASELRNVLAPLRGTAVVVKPTVSGSAWNTVRGVAGTEELDSAVAKLPQHLAYLVQPFVPEVAREGEWSLLFFGGAYSHAVCKRPASDDYRVQREFGGSVDVITPPPEALAAAQHALGAVATMSEQRDFGRIAYARIDGVRSGGQFLIMEIELIEPFLFLRGVPDASRSFADVIARELKAVTHSALSA
jgi:glutathione synthase/RimK-type ligase-like ATP-grasp enzyme